MLNNSKQTWHRAAQTNTHCCASCWNSPCWFQACVQREDSWNSENLPTKIMWPWSSAYLIVARVYWLASSFFDILDKPFSSATFPSEVKTSLVKPLLKKHNLDHNQLKNYRPVSNLPLLSKLQEKVVLSQSTEHLNKNKLTLFSQLTVMATARRQHFSMCPVTSS